MTPPATRWPTPSRRLVTPDELFAACFDDLILKEGGYSDHPADTGGRTMYGITEATARAAGYTGPMRDLTLPIARDIYRRRYWHTLRLDEIAILSAALAEELFDTAVNMGVGTAARFLQTALNALNREGRDYPDMAIDGRLGPGTLAALRRYLAVRGAEGSTVLRRALDCQQGAKYLAIAAADPRQEAFVFGWLRARVG